MPEDRGNEIHLGCGVDCDGGGIDVAMSKGTPTSPDLHGYADARLRIVYCTGSPHALDIWKISETEVRVFGLIWTDADAVVVIHRGGSWEQYLRRVAVGCGAVAAVGHGDGV